MESKKKILTLVFIFTILSTTFTMLPATDTPERGPGMSDYYATIVPDPDTQVAKLRADVVQAIDVPYYYLVDELRNEGFFVHEYPMSTVFEYYDINVGGWKHRDYIPEPYGGFPLNSTHFRRAIAYVRNVESAMATSPMLQGFTIRNRGWIGQFTGKWYNPNAEAFDYRPDLAIHEMFLGEFVPYSKTTGLSMTEEEAKANPGDIDHWSYEPAGTPIGPTGPIRSLEVYAATSWPYYVDMANTWVAGLEGIGIHTTTYYAMWLWIWIKVSRGKYDIGVFGTAWSRPDPYIMDFYFASWNQPKLPSNSPCCNWRFYENPEVDDLIRTYGTTLNETEAVQAAHRVQEIIASEAIMPAAFTWKGYAAFHPDLMGIMKSTHGTDRALSYFQTSWWDPTSKVAHDNAIKTAWYEEPEDLNPNMQIGVTASWLIAAVIDGYGGGFGLTIQDPVTLETKPWIAWKWKNETWEVEPGKLGSKITYYLRQDVYWHDGVQFTADDVKFCLEYLRDHGHAAGQSRFATGDLHNVTVVDVDGDGWNEAVVYHSTTSLFHLTYTSFWAAEFPKHIWEGVVDPTAVTPWKEPNPVVGEPLTKLVGTGPFVYYMGDWVEGQYVRFRANPNYFRSAELSITDTNLDFITDVFDAIPLTINFGKGQGEAGYDIHYDINNNGVIDIYDAILVSANFGEPW